MYNVFKCVRLQNKCLNERRLDIEANRNRSFKGIKQMPVADRSESQGNLYATPG